MADLGRCGRLDSTKYLSWAMVLIFDFDKYIFISYFYERSRDIFMGKQYSGFNKCFSAVVCTIAFIQCGDTPVD